MKKVIKLEVIDKENKSHIFNCTRLKRNDKTQLRSRVRIEKISSAYAEIMYVGSVRFLFFYIREEESVLQVVFNLENIKIHTLKRLVRLFKVNGIDVKGL